MTPARVVSALALSLIVAFSATAAADISARVAAVFEKSPSALTEFETATVPQHRAAGGEPQWFQRGERFIRWAATGTNAQTFVIVDAAAGSERPVSSPAALNAQLTKLLGKQPPVLRRVNFALMPDEKGVLFGFAGKAVLLDFATASVSEVSRASILVRALAGGRLSPDARHAATTRGGGFTLAASSGTLIEHKREEDVEWRLAEEAWSPDGRFLLVQRGDTSGVHKIPLVDFSKPLETVSKVPYSKAGTPLTKWRFLVVDPAAARMTEVASLHEEGYWFHVGWRPDGGEALVLFLTRDGKQLDLYAIDPVKASSRLVLREENRDTFVQDLNFFSGLMGGGWRMQVTPLPDNSRFLWASERDGHRNLYLYRFDGRLERQVTSGPLVVHDVLRVAPPDVYVQASVDADAPYDRHVYRVSLRGGDPSRLTSEPGIHLASFSPSGAYFVDTHSSRTRPPVTEIRSEGASKKTVLWRADVSKLERAGYVPPEAFTATAADGVTKIHGAILKPYDFDPARRYPVVNYIYGGPFRTILPWGYVGCRCSPASGFDAEAVDIAQAGFVVVMVDGRGTPDRSKAFHDATYGRIGQTEIADQVAAIRAAAATRPYMDLERVGIYGASWGGYYAIRGMLTATGTYKAGYAWAPGSPWEAAAVNEPNLGLPAQNPAGYEAAANEPLAANLKGALKLVHGTADDSAPIESTMRIADALIRAGKAFEMLIVPGEGHRPQDESHYFYQDMIAFFIEHLGQPSAP